MPPAHLAAAQALIRETAIDRNAGSCSWACGRPATNGCHRLPAGQGGPYILANIIGGCGSGTTGCHWRTEQARALSYACGWLIRSDTQPAARAARIAATPALITTQLGAGWHQLDDGHGLASRYDEPLPDGMWTGTFDEAITELRRIARGTAA